jgi:hypothetical protein
MRRASYYSRCVTHPQENHIHDTQLCSQSIMNLHRHKHPFDETKHRLSLKSVSVSVIRELTEPHWEVLAFRENGAEEHPQRADHYGGILLPLE